MARPLVPALVLGLALLAGSARADQLEWVPRADAERAAAVLTPGSLVVSWVSHMNDSRPVIYWVEKAEVKDVSSPGLAEVRATVIKVASSRTLRQPTSGPFKFDLGKADGPEQALTLDLAYTYVCSSEMPGVFVNLGKRLGLECEVRAPAIEVGAATVEAITVKVEAATAALLSPAPVCEDEGSGSASPARGIVDRIPGE